MPRMNSLNNRNSQLSSVKSAGINDNPISDKIQSQNDLSLQHNPLPQQLNFIDEQNINLNEKARLYQKQTRGSIDVVNISQLLSSSGKTKGVP